MKGLIVKGIAGFYYVSPLPFRQEGQVYQCKARGIFKKEGITPMVGDEVILSLQPAGDAVIEEILPRKNSFIRPPIANVDCFIVVIAAAEPAPNRAIIDRFLVMAEKHQVESVLCINKIDLAEDAKLARIKATYEDLYPLLLVSGETAEGADQLSRILVGKKCAFAGPSGVGKSTLLNLLQPDILAETGEISSKTLRGKHTTRHVEIFAMGSGAMIFDTPGFTSFDVLEAQAEELQFLYPEMLDFIGACRYDNCRHMKEPDCAVREAVQQGKIKKSRYTSYVEQLAEIREREKNKY